MMINLRQKFRGLFDDRVQKRGIELFNLGKVTRKTTGGPSATYSVKDRGFHQVQLNLDSPKLSTCTCKEYEDGLWCRHIWACVVDQDALLEETAAPAPTLEKSKEESIPQANHQDPKPESASGSETETAVMSDENPDWLEKFRLALKKDGPISLSKLEQRTLYVLNLPKSKEIGSLVVEPWYQEKMPTGHWGAIRSSQAIKSESHIQASVARAILKDLSQTKILYYQSTQKNRFLEPVEFRDEVVKFKIAVSKIDGHFFARGILVLPDAQHELTEVDEFFNHFIIIRNNLYEIGFKDEIRLYEFFKKERAVEITPGEFDRFLNFFLLENKKIDLKLPPDMEFQEISTEPTVRLQILQQDTKNNYVVNFDYHYNEKVFDPEEVSSWIYDLENRRKFARNHQVESQLEAEVKRAGLLGSNKLKNLNQTILNQDALLDCIDVAAENNWSIMMNQKILRKGVSYSARLKSQVNWFEMVGTFDFGAERVDLPNLLKALRKDQRIVTLASGEMAYIPKLWAQKFKMMARLGQESENGIKISKVQALFLSSFFNDDKSFFIEDNSDSIQTVIESVKELHESTPSQDFQGDLRPYQKKGLAWIELLKSEQIGGILADDMGLGKTVMVLSALSKLSAEGHLKKRSLIVSPKTLVFNWISEAKKFTPRLNFVEYTGTRRREVLAQAPENAIVVTTYHTLRQDIDDFKSSTFDFLIMDEAHYIKNADSQSYMACRMLQAEHKYALTGTPVENSIQDLFSLLSVVNPGMITESSAQRIERDPEAIRVLARALQPFVLRRTKEQVLKELPEKVEQIVYCDLSPEERKKYDELKQFYWQQIAGEPGEQNAAINTNRIQVLEALLRLRQAACHQGLLDENLQSTVSSKFECVMESLETILAEGKKALIFSQFTSLLKLFSNQLEAKGIKFSYLDGKTKDRAEIVQDFQNNEDSKIFLISLKAGGVGLNLTAAEYVFILDPWWNPAAENQAIDRAHRIGQENTVFAYKIIARDTIEEKILELQKSKLELAKNVVGTDSSLIKNLSLEDLKYLFT